MNITRKCNEHKSLVEPASQQDNYAGYKATAAKTKLKNDYLKNSVRLTEGTQYYKAYLKKKVVTGLWKNNPLW